MTSSKGHIELTKEEENDIKKIELKRIIVEEEILKLNPGQDLEQINYLKEHMYKDFPDNVCFICGSDDIIIHFVPHYSFHEVEYTDDYDESDYVSIDRCCISCHKKICKTCKIKNNILDRCKLCNIAKSCKDLFEDFFENV